MVKHVFVMLNAVRPDALAFFGWLAFVAGVLVEQTWLKLILLSAARVLP
jgi:hypothetical protein